MNESTLNPYAPPTTTDKLIADELELNLWREGDLLVVRTGATLPRTCLVTGEPGVYSHLINQIWQPRWVYSLMFLFLLPYFLVSPFVHRRIELMVPFGRTVYAKHRRIVRTGFMLVFIAILLFGIIILAWRAGVDVQVGSLLTILSLIVFLVGVSLASRYPMKLDVLKVEADRIYIQQVHSKFLAELPAPFE